MAGKPRAKVRLRLDRGTAQLRELNVGSVVCDVMDVSEGGCACRLVFSKIGGESVDSWKHVLVPGRILTLDLSDSLGIPGLVIPECQVRWVQSQRSTELIFGVSFSGINDVQMQMLGQAIMMLASKKLRSAKAAPPSAARPPSVPDLPEIPPPPPAPKAAAPAVRQKPAVPAAPPAPFPARSAPTPKAQAEEVKPKAEPLPQLRVHERSHEPKWAAKESGRGKTGLWKEAQSLERQKRHSADFPVVYEFVNPETGKKLSRRAVEGRVVDFNEGGFLIEGPGPDFAEPKALVGSTIMLATLRVGVNELAAKLEIVSIKESPRVATLILYGVRILDMPEGDRAFLRELYIRASLSNITLKKKMK